MRQHFQIACAVLTMIAAATALDGAEAGRRLPAPPNRIELRSASMAFTLDANSLGGVRWQNRIARTSLDLRGGCELEVEVGDKPQAGAKSPFPAGCGGGAFPQVGPSRLAFPVVRSCLAATLVYQIDPQFPVLRKFVELANTGQQPLRVLNVVLGRYPVQAKAEGGERGFPLYLADEYFVSLAHPAGFARLENGQVVLRQYPGARLAPGGKARVHGGGLWGCPAGRGSQELRRLRPQPHAPRPPRPRQAVRGVGVLWRPARQAIIGRRKSICWNTWARSPKAGKKAARNSTSTRSSSGTTRRGDLTSFIRRISPTAFRRSATRFSASA